MNRLAVSKIKQISAVLVLVIVTLACNIPNVRDMVREAIYERCYPVDRVTYVSAATELGLTPKTPQYPESAVYKVCYIEVGKTDELTSVRMIDGKRSTKVESGKPTLAGTYIGENLETPSDWELVQSEFTIQVAEDGTISGSRIFIIRKQTIGATCTWRYENGHNTTIRGQVSSADGFVIVENDSYTISDGSECGGLNDHQTFESVCDRAQITISGDRLEINGDGSVDCGFVFKAKKQ